MTTKQTVIDLNSVRQQLQQLNKNQETLLSGQDAIRNDQSLLSGSINGLAQSIDGFKELFKSTVPLKIVVYLLFIVLAQVGGIAVIQIVLPNLFK